LRVLDGIVAPDSIKAGAKIMGHAQKPESLKHRLKHFGIAQADFADICQVSEKTVNNWLSGRAKINPTALVLLDLIEHSAELRHMLCVGEKFKGAPRGKPFAAGNPYRFGDRRRAVSVAGARMARAAA
jgi:DNA-binding XRE family transcriptional regulator